MAKEPTPLPVLLGALQDKRDIARKILAYTVNAAADAALKNGQPQPAYTPGMEDDSRRIGHLDELIGYIAGWCRREADFFAGALGNPVATIDGYEPLSPLHAILDGCDGLVRTTIDRDMGRTCDLHVRSEIGEIRWLRVPRAEIVAIRCKPLPVPQLLGHTAAPR
jgi:hypothetical protein